MNYIIFQTAFIGDIILCTSLVQSIKDLDPDAVIIFITTPIGESLLQNNQKIDKIIVYDKRFKQSGLKGILNIAKDIKKIVREEESVYISPHRFARASILGFLVGSGVRIGFESSTLSFFYKKVVPYKFGIHEIERNFELLSAVFGEKLYSINPKRPELFPRESDFVRIKSLLNDKFGSYDVVSIAPGSVWQTKRWPLEYYEKLIALLSDYGIRTILIGGENDKAISERLAGKDVRTSDMVLNLAGKLTLLESAAAVSLSNAIVTNDSAPLHIASAMNIPSIAIFGSTTPYLGFGPLAESSIILENKNLNCRPCGLHGSKSCKEGHLNCMMEIYPETVFDEVVNILQTTS